VVGVGSCNPGGAKVTARHGKTGSDMVLSGQKNGPGPSVDALGEFPDLTTLGVASDR
jgi:hypothetical protein